MSSTPIQLIRELNAIGVPVSDLWDLVNGKVQYEAAIPVLIDWLQHVDARVPMSDRAKVREGLIRALSVPGARPAAAPVLIDEFQQADDPSGLGIRWTIGNALSVVADDSVFDEIEQITRTRDYGKARQMVVLGLIKSKDPRAVPLLVDLLKDDDVAAQAAMALGKIKPAGVRPALERLRDHPQPLVRREAKKALSRLGG